MRRRRRRRRRTRTMKNWRRKSLPRRSLLPRRQVAGLQCPRTMARPMLAIRAMRARRLVARQEVPSQVCHADSCTPLHSALGTFSACMASLLLGRRICTWYSDDVALLLQLQGHRRTGRQLPRRLWRPRKGRQLLLPMAPIRRQLLPSDAVVHCTAASLTAGTSWQTPYGSLLLSNCHQHHMLARVDFLGDRMLFGS